MPRSTTRTGGPIGSPTLGSRSTGRVRETAPVITRTPVPVETAPPPQQEPTLPLPTTVGALREDLDRLDRQETELGAQLDEATDPRDREALRAELERIQATIRTGEAMLKRSSFKRIGEPRVAAAIRAIELLWPLADRSRYGYLERDIVKLEDTLTSVVVTTVELFRRGRGRVATFHFDNGNGFTYDEEVPPDIPDEEEEG